MLCKKEFTAVFLSMSDSFSQYIRQGSSSHGLQVLFLKIVMVYKVSASSFRTQVWLDKRAESQSDLMPHLTSGQANCHLSSSTFEAQGCA